MQRTVIFKNRQEAGQKLAAELENIRDENPIILGMPRGGVVVAYEIARILHAPLDVIVARKIGAPTQPEYAIGAIAPGDVRLFNVEALAAMGLSEVELENLVAQEKREMDRRTKLYRQNRPALDLKDRVVIIVDDGVATGLSALAAVRAVKKMQPKKIIFAAGVSALDSANVLRKEVNSFVCMSISEDFYAVGAWFAEFEQTSDAEVIALLHQNQKEQN